MINFAQTIKRVKRRTKKTYGEQFPRNGKGTYIINMKTDTIGNLMDDYSICGNRSIKDGVHASIEDVVHNLPLKADIEFNIEISQQTEKENKLKSVFANSFKHKYILESLNNERYKKNNLIISLICITAAILIFGGLTAVELFVNEEFNKLPETVWEIIVICGWVLAWEAFDRLVFGQNEINFKQVKNYHLYHSNIRFKYAKKVDINEIDKVANINPAQIISTFNKLDNDQKKEEAKITKTEEKKFEKTAKIDVGKISTDTTDKNKTTEPKITEKK